MRHSGSFTLTNSLSAFLVLTVSSLNHDAQVVTGLEKGSQRGTATLFAKGSNEDEPGQWKALLFFISAHSDPFQIHVSFVLLCIITILLLYIALNIYLKLSLTLFPPILCIETQIVIDSCRCNCVLHEVWATNKEAIWRSSNHLTCNIFFQHHSLCRKYLENRIWTYLIQTDLLRGVEQRKGKNMQTESQRIKAKANKH